MSLTKEQLEAFKVRIRESTPTIKSNPSIQPEDTESGFRFLGAAKAGLKETVPGLALQLAGVVDRDEFKPRSFGEKAVKFGTSLLDPTLLLGAGLGGIATRGAIKSVAGPGSKALIGGAISGGSILGTQTAFKSPIEQKLEKDDIDVSQAVGDTLRDTVIGAGLGAGVGVIGGIVTKGSIKGFQKEAAKFAGGGEVTSPIDQVFKDAGIVLKKSKSGGLIDAANVPKDLKEARTIAGTYFRTAGQDLTPGQTKVMADAFKVNAQDINTWRRGTIPFKEQERLAKQVGISFHGDDVFYKSASGKLTKFEIGQPVPTEVNLKLKQMTLNLSKEIDDLTKISNRTPHGEQKLQDLIRTHVLLMNRGYGVRAEIGRALGAERFLLRPVDKMEREIAKISQIMSKDEIKMLTEDIAKARIKRGELLAKGIDEFRSLTPIAEVIQKYSHATLGEKLINLSVLFKLTSPVTQARNIIGNTSFLASNVIEKFTSAAIDLPLTFGRGIVGKGFNRERFFSEGFAELGGIFFSMKKALSTALPAMLDDTYASQATKVGEVFINRAAIKGVFGKVLNTMTTRPLAAGDIFFRTLSTEAVKYSEITRALIKKGLTPGSEKFTTAFRQMLIDTPAEILEKASSEATKRVFQAPLTGLFQSIETFRSRHPSLRLILPFLRTPSNIFIEGVRRSPAAPLLPSFRAQIRAGGEQAADALARMVVGTTGAGLLGVTAISGKLDITGPAPKLRGDKEIFLNSGKKPFSIRIGDTWYTYRGIEPFSTILAQAAALKDAWESRDFKGYEEIAGKMVLDMYNFSKDQTFLQGISQLFKFTEDVGNEGFRNSFIGFLARGSLVPVLAQQIATTADPTLRFRETPFEQVVSGIPGFSKSLVPRRSISGEIIEPVPIPKEEGVIERAVKFLPRGLTRPSPAKDDEFNTELLRLNKVVGFRDEPIGTVFRGLKLTAEERDLYQRVVGPIVDRRRRELFENENRILVKGKFKLYKNMDDFEKKDSLNKIEKDVRDEFIKQSKFRAKALIRNVNERQSVDEKRRFLNNLAARGHLNPKELKDVIRAFGLGK